MSSDADAFAGEGAEAVIHAATAIPTDASARKRRAWAENDRLRRDGTRALTEAAAMIGARRYLQQSVAWVVRTAPDGPYNDERTPPERPLLLRSAEGIGHVVDDEPVPFARFLSYFAEAIGAPRPGRVPLWVARLVLGKDAVESLTTSMNTSNRKIRMELGWAPRYPTYRDGIAQMVHQWSEPPPAPGGPGPAGGAA